MGLNRRATEFGTTLGDASFTVTSAAVVGLSPPDNCAAAVVSIGAQPVRMRSSQGSPSASLGHLLAADSAVTFLGPDVYYAKFIAVGADSVCFVTFFGD